MEVQAEANGKGSSLREWSGVLMRQMTLGGLVFFLISIFSIGANNARAADAADAGAAFKTDQAVEVKWGAAWRKATVDEFDGKYYLIHYNNKFFNEWVTPERIRTIGSTRDIPRAEPTPRGKKPDGSAAGGNAGGNVIERKTAAPAAAESIADALDAQNGDIASAKDIAPGKTWTYQAGRAPAAKFSDISMTIPAGNRDFSGLRIQPVKFSDPDAGLAVVTHLEEHIKDTAASIELLDLKTGQSRGTYGIPSMARADGLSPSGRWLLLGGTKNLDADTESRLSLVDLAAKPPKTVAAFLPYGNLEKKHRGVKEVLFVDETHILTMNDAYRIVLWQLPECKPVYGIKLDGRNVFPGPVLSPDRKYMMLEDANGFYFYNALSGEAAGTIDFPIVISEFTASCINNHFSPDGTQLAHVHAHGVQIISLDPGAAHKVTLDIPKIDPHAFGDQKKTVWLDAKHMLLNNRDLLDLDKEIVVWQYEIPESGAQIAQYGDRFWVFRELQSPREVKINSYVLPEQKTIDAANALDPAKLFVINPGDKVSLVMNVGEGEAAKRLSEHFTQELKDKGYVQAENQPIKLEVTIGGHIKQKDQYRVAGSVKDASVDVQGMTVRFSVDGKTMWEHKIYSGAPQMLMVKQGQSLDSAIKDKQADDWHQLEAVALPKRVPFPRDPPGFGKSDLGGGESAKSNRRGNK